MLSTKTFLGLLFSLSLCFIGSRIEESSNWYLVVSFSLLTTILISLAFYKTYRYLKSIDFLVWKKRFWLRREIRRFNRKIFRMNKKYETVVEKLDAAKELGQLRNDVAETVTNNLKIWDELFTVYEKVIDLYERRIKKMEQRKTEIKLLRFLVNKVKEDPGIDRHHFWVVRIWRKFRGEKTNGLSNRELTRLEKWTSNIDGKTQEKLNYQIKLSLKNLEVANRELALRNLEEKINSLKSEL